MTAAVLSDHVAAYAAQVRAHLADLTFEQIEDLTDGLEADLIEALEDPEARPVTGEIPLAGTRDAATTPSSTTSLPDAATTSIINLAERFGPPKAYAEELRSAAGLPAPSLVKAPKPAKPPLVHRLRTRLIDVRARLVAQPWWPGVRATAEALRPVWWVARGWVLYSIFVTMVSGSENVAFVPNNLFGILLLLGVVAASVQYGQGRWTLAGKGRHVLTAVSVVAVVGLFPTLATAVAHSTQVDYINYGGPEPIADGVYFGGLPVTNLFVYDADGKFIDQAQIVDDKGRPVRVDREGGLWDESTGLSRYWSAAQDSYGRDIWNAFPLRMWNDQDGEWDDKTQNWVLPDGVSPTVMPPPFAQLAPIAKDQGAPAVEPGDPGQVAPTDPTAPTDPATDVAPGDGASDSAASGDTAPADPAPADPADPLAPGVADVPPAG
ncbi:hypothetical protein SAMN05216410_2523 [Sanguibacter gelidistatuariae]|uniref:Uncharacterized protein n=1 Tax=Sanguibacter gelidistatuariae TaxID=1814289 RepID=A0A1G6QFF6_9MICO|nr:hypothetical protein [Sanguibacter gelidistatuariae]SDC90891.1 hypothetical protein SAMN05216410_2523 [Sanguibacter gelidistatuariae]